MRELALSDGLIPKSRVFDRADELQFNPSDERLERFYETQLLRELDRIEGTTERGFTPAHADRFLGLLWLCKVLPKPRAPELAFWLCFYGYDDVPADLVCEHVEAAVRTFLSGLRREFQRKGVPLLGVKDLATWYNVGKPFAKAALKYLVRRPVRGTVALAALTGMFGLALRALISKSSFDAVATWLGKVGYLIGIDRGKTDALREVWSVLSEGMSLFELDQRKNPLVKAVQEVHASDSQEIVGLVRDSKPIVWHSGTLIPLVRPQRPPLADDPTDPNAVLLARYFLPIAVAGLALCRKVTHTIELRRQLREGNYEQIACDYHQVKIITDDIAKRIGLGENK